MHFIKKEESTVDSNTNQNAYKTQNIENINIKICSDSDLSKENFINSEGLGDFVPIDKIYEAKNKHKHTFVFKILKKSQQKMLIAKMLTNMESKEIILKEVEMSKKISKLSKKYFMQFQENHPIWLKGLKTARFSWILIFECGLNSMENILKKRKQYLESEIIFIWQTVFCPALALLHEKNIYHFDLKPANIILCDENGKYIYKIGDFGSAIKNSDQIISYTDIYSEPCFKKCQKEEHFIFPNQCFPGHDIYTLIITTFEMMGLSLQEIEKIKNEASFLSFPPRISQNYSILCGIFVKYLKNPYDYTIQNLNNELNNLESKTPDDTEIISHLQAQNRRRFLEKRKGGPDSLEGDTGIFQQYLALNMLRYLHSKEPEQYFKMMDEIMDREQKKLNLTDFNNDVRKIFIRFEGYNALDNVKEAKNCLIKLKDILKQNPMQNSDLRNFYLLALNLYISERLNDNEEIRKTTLEIYWRSCNCLTPVSFLGNVLKFENKWLFSKAAHFFNRSISIRPSDYVKDIESIKDLDFNFANIIKKKTTEFNDILLQTVKETEIDTHGYVSCWKPTLGHKFLENLSQILDLNIFDEEKYLNMMEFQFLQLRENYKDPRKLKGLLEMQLRKNPEDPKILKDLFRQLQENNENPTLLEDFLLVSQHYYENEISPMNAEIHLLLAKSKKITSKNIKKIHLKKALNILEFLNENLTRNKENLQNERIMKLKKLMNSYHLFQKFEKGERKQKIKAEYNEFEKILKDLKGEKEIEKEELSSSCKYLIFYDLFLKEKIKNIKKMLAFG